MSSIFSSQVGRLQDLNKKVSKECVLSHSDNSQLKGGYKMALDIVLVITRLVRKRLDSNIESKSLNNIFMLTIQTFRISECLFSTDRVCLILFYCLRKVFPC